MREGINFPQAIALIKNSATSFPDINAKKVIFLLGPTGSGKTTTIQFLSGHKLIKNEKGHIVLQNPECSNLTIGTQTKSETKYIGVQEIETSSGNFIFVDGPGFNDTEGPEMDLANTVSIANVFQQCESVIPILLMPYDCLTAERGRLFRELINYICSIFNPRDLTRSMLLWVSRTPAGFDNSDLLKYLTGILEATSAENSNELVNFVENLIERIEEEDDSVRIIKPLEDRVNRYHKFLSKCKGIKNPKESFKFRLSTSVQSLLLNSLDSVEMEIETNLESRQSAKIRQSLETFVAVAKYVVQVNATHEKCCKKLEQWILKNQKETIDRFELILKNKNYIDKDMEKLNEFHLILQDIQQLREFVESEFYTVESFESFIVSSIREFSRGTENIALSEFELMRLILETVGSIQQSINFCEEEIDRIQEQLRQTSKNKVQSINETIKGLEINAETLDQFVFVIENLSSAVTILENVVDINLSEILEHTVQIIRDALQSKENQFSQTFLQFIDCRWDYNSDEKKEFATQLENLSADFLFFKIARDHNHLTKYLPKEEIQQKYNSIVDLVVKFCNSTIDSIQENLSSMTTDFNGCRSQIYTINKLGNINKDIKRQILPKFQKLLQSLNNAINSVVDDLESQFEKNEPDFPQIKRRMAYIEKATWLDEYIFGIKLRYNHFQENLESQATYFAKRAFSFYQRQKYDDLIVIVRNLNNMSELFPRITERPLSELTKKLSCEKIRLSEHLQELIYSQEKIDLEVAEYFLKWMKSTKLIWKELMPDEREKDLYLQKKFKSTLIDTANRQLEKIPDTFKDIESLDFVEYRNILDYLHDIESIEILKNNRSLSIKYQTAKDKVQNLIDRLNSLFKQIITQSVRIDVAQRILEKLNSVSLSGHFPDLRETIEKLYDSLDEQMSKTERSIAKQFEDGNFRSLMFQINSVPESLDTRNKAERIVATLIHRKQSELKALVNSLKYPFDLERIDKIQKGFETLSEIQEVVKIPDLSPTPAESVDQCYKLLDMKVGVIYKDQRKLLDAFKFSEWDDFIYDVNSAFHFENFLSNCRTIEHLIKDGDSNEHINANIDKLTQSLSSNQIVDVNNLYDTLKKIANEKPHFLSNLNRFKKTLWQYVVEHLPKEFESITEKLSKLEILESSLVHLDPELKDLVSYNNIKSEKDIQIKKILLHKETMRNLMREYNFEEIDKIKTDMKDISLISSTNEIIIDGIEKLYSKFFALSNNPPRRTSRNKNENNINSNSIEFILEKLDEAERIFTPLIGIEKRPIEFKVAIEKILDDFSKTLQKIDAITPTNIIPVNSIVHLLQLKIVDDVISDDTKIASVKALSQIASSLSNCCELCNTGIKQGNFIMIAEGLNNIEQVNDCIVQLKEFTQNPISESLKELDSTLSGCLTLAQAEDKVTAWIGDLSSVINENVKQSNLNFAETLLHTLQQKSILSNRFPNIETISLNVIGQLKRMFYGTVEKAASHKADKNWEKLNESFAVLKNWKRIGEVFNDPTCSVLENLMTDEVAKIEIRGKQHTDVEKIAKDLVAMNVIAEGFPHTRTVVNQSCRAILANISGKSMIEKLAINLQTLGRHGNEILAEYPQFVGFQKTKWTRKTAKDINYAIGNFIITDGKQTMWQKIEGENGNEKRQWEEDYKVFLREFRALTGSGSWKPAAISEIVSKISKLFERSYVDIPTILANIFAVWSLEALNVDFCETEYIKQPHPVQVLCLFRLLRQNRSSYESQLIEMLTGEGKSVVLGVCSIFFALKGYNVSCTSYSKYLSERDYNLFAKLFKHFKVDAYISYFPISDLCERKTINSLPEMLKNVLQDENYTFKGSISNRKSILLIDEVDVFFGSDFRGKMYNPITVFSDDDTFNLLKFIWSQRNSNISFNNISNTACYLSLLKKFQGWESFMRNEVLKMIVDVKDFANPIYRVMNGKICYKDHDSFSSNIAHRYKTAFAYFNERDSGNISNDIVKEQTGILLNCGSFLFAEIPKQFDLVMGVSASLSDFSDIEKEIVESYGISKLAFAPSVYEKSRNFDPDRVTVHKGMKEGDRSDWFLYIYQIAENKIRTGRAILIFFDNIDILDQFMRLYGNNLPTGSVSILHEGEEFKENIVRKSTGSGQVTLCTRPFGRGVDFVCRDDTTLANGGVHVILTFPTNSKAEEIQIRGRTARQGDVGSWEIVLFIEDLQHLSISWEIYEQQGSNFYQYFKQTRDNQLKSNLSKLIDNSKKALVLHNHSLNFHKLLTSNGSRDQIMQAIKDINMFGVKTTTSFFHIYFCLDDSGSMSGAPWRDLVSAVSAFIKKRLDFFVAEGIQPGDLVTIVNYSSSAQVMCQSQPINTNPERHTRFRNGSTCFSAGLAAIYTEMTNNWAQDKTRVPVLLFMSDGGSSDGELQMQMISRDFSSCGLKLFSVAFGSGCNRQKMESLARIGGGKYFFGKEGAALKSEFESICAEICHPSFSML